MSTMLRSTNPAAVDAADPDRDRRIPYVGQIVIFHARPGEGFAGKMQAPAVVTTIEDEDHVEIIIIKAADDFVGRWKIPRRTEQNPFNSWSFNAHDVEHYQPGAGKPAEPKPEGHLTWDDVKAMHDEMGALRNKVAALEGRKR